MNFTPNLFMWELKFDDMGRKRVVKTYTDTSAKGDRTPIEGWRYFVHISLVSIKVEEETDHIGRTSEIYIEMGSRLRSKRTPDHGEIEIDRNEVFKPSDGLSLYSEFIEKKDGGSIEVPFRVYDKDLGKDDKLIDVKLTIKLGQGKEYESFGGNGVKAKLAISANRTRF